MARGRRSQPSNNQPEPEVSSWLSGMLHALSGAAVILEVPSGNEMHQQVVQQFTQQWKHPTQVPTVIKLWRIYADQTVLDRFSNYQRGVENSRGIPGGNTRRRFHGTVRECCLGDTSSENALCRLTTCNLCRIIQSSFQLAKAGQRTNFGRFGAGIYTSATSSKANDYSFGSASPNKAMLVNDVVMGKVVKLTRTDTSLGQPPHGFDAVIGEPGGDLNYDECVVYNNDAIRPSFLVIYR
ncbi:ADP-ribosylation [Russula vinacea]|nr:ADP-ribosylation [Russula vinacea]